MQRMAWLGRLSQLVLLIAGAGCQPMDSSELPPHVAGELYWLPVFEGQGPGAASEGSTDPATAMSRDDDGDADDSPSANGDDPLLSVSPVELELDWPSDSATFYVRNIGGGTLQYKAVTDADWVLLTNASGTSDGEARPIGVTVDGEQLMAGQHLASILVLAGQQQAVVRVLLGVEDRPENPPALAKIVPWAECNWTAYFEQTVEGLLIWQNLCDTAIISTTPNHAYFYSELRVRVPGMRIIPGLKTCYSLEQFDSVPGWEAVAQELATIRETSGEQVVLLENESALEPHVAGLEPLDLEQLREALAALPTDLEYIWFPSIYEPSIGDGMGPERSALICEVVEEVLASVRFIEQRYCSKGSVNSPMRIAAKRRLDAIASRPTLPMQYFMGVRDGYAWWLDEEVHEALSYIRQDWGEDADVTFYTGNDRWVEAAQSLSPLLTEMGY